MARRRDEDSRLCAVLLDIGGTLWPGSWSATDAIWSIRMSQLRAAISGYTGESAETFHARLVERMSEQMRRAWRGGTYEQDTAGVILQVAREFGLPPSAETVLAVRRARRVSPRGHTQPFPGALDLLGVAKSRGMRCAAVSNADWRGGEEYRLDFADLGLDGYFDAVITSLDVGFVKPHPAMFEAAAAAVGCGAAGCVMIGNSEAKDIAPAAELGMRTILVAIEAPKPETSGADAIVGSLTEAAEVLRTWTDAYSAASNSRL